MAVAFDGEAVSTMAYSGVTSASASHTTAGSDRVAVLCLPYTVSVTEATATYGGSSMANQITRRHAGTGDVGLAITSQRSNAAA